MAEGSVDENQDVSKKPFGIGWRTEDPIGFKGVGAPLLKEGKCSPLGTELQERLRISIKDTNSELVPKFKFTGIDTSGWTNVSENFARTLNALKAVDTSRIQKIMADAMEPTRQHIEQINKSANIMAPLIAHLEEQRQSLLEGIKQALKPTQRYLSRALMQRVLPPNLWGIWDQITTSEILDFTAREAIPIYLVPSADNALRFIKAPDQARRRRVLYDRKEALIQDCEAALGGLRHPEVEEGVELVRDGIAAFRAGHHRAAQALFTTVFDTTISDFYPHRWSRKRFTVKKVDESSRPEEIEQLPLMEKFVWLAVWNAHAEYHPDDEPRIIPREYTRHATVHGASRKQYTQRNAVQVMLLVTSLIGLKDAQIELGKFNPDYSKPAKKPSN